MHPLPQPTDGVGRLEVLDALRGFALFGILLANILYWSGWVLGTDAQRIAWAGVDAQAWQYRFHHLFVDGKFYTVFSLLFGAGFALQLDRLVRRGQDGLRIYRRRVLVLLAFGLVHSFVVWDGDILTLYALLGLALPLFRQWSERSLLVVAALLVFVVPPVGASVVDAFGWPADAGAIGLSLRIAEALGADTRPESVLDWVGREDLRGWLAWVSSGPLYSWGLRLESWRIPKVLGIMLLGMAVGRRLADGRLPADRTLLRKVALAGLAVGLPASLAYALRPGLGQTDWSSQLGTLPLALAYAALFALAWPWMRRALAPLAAVGRMALTNYLTHSFVGVIVFYGIGFGLVGQLSLVQIHGFAIALFLLQCAFSQWWLRRHAQGPMEALWRRLTYGDSRGGAPVPASSA